jgi:hypothetical protein
MIRTSLDGPPMTDAAAFSRSCGTCTLCCKVFEVPPIDNKPRGIWCKHCKPGKGCGIWANRPDFCRDFHCMWIQDETLGPEWKPEKARFVLNYRRDLGVLNVMVDVGQPHAWKQEPYLSGLKRFADRANAFKHIVQVTIGRHVLVLSPERVFDMGHTDDDLEHVWHVTRDPSGKESFKLADVRKRPSPAGA